MGMREMDNKRGGGGAGDDIIYSDIWEEQGETTHAGENQTLCCS